MLLRPYAGRNGDRLVLLVVLVTCRSASTSISPPSARRRCKKQHCSSCAPSLLYLAGLPCLALPCLALSCLVLPAHRDRAREAHKQASKQASPLREGEGSEADSWSAGITCTLCVQAIEQQSRAQPDSVAYSGAWGAKRALERAACWLAFHFPPPLLLLPAPSFVIRLAARALQPLHPPSRLASNATHTQPRPHPRLHRPRCYSARSQRPLRALHTAHCTALHRSALHALAPAVRTPPAVVHACAPPSPTTRGANRLRLSARILLHRPRGHCAGSSPAPLARELATQGTAKNRYPKATVRHQQPGKGATGWDAGSLVCNNLHVQWILVQSTQQH